MYNKTGRGEPNPSQGDPQPSAPAQAPGPAGLQHLGDNPGLAKVHQIMARVLLLQEDVDEFVGKKTDKSYRYLEELLTKELLDLDSVETQGQENVRQYRREAVQRIQSILDQLEKKAFWSGFIYWVYGSLSFAVSFFQIFHEHGEGLVLFFWAVISRLFSPTTMTWNAWSKRQGPKNKYWYKESNFSSLIMLVWVTCG